MPTKRTVIDRPRQRKFSSEALALFGELERIPRSSPKFRVGSQRLAAELGLTDEWWTGCHVSDRSVTPPIPALAAAAWATCRAVREALLEAIRGREPGECP
jgi:hypothetical protein